MLIPWPNRIQDGSYEFQGRRHQLPLTEPEHSERDPRPRPLGRVAGAGATSRTASCSGTCSIAQPGYPFSLRAADRVRAVDDRPHRTDDCDEHRSRGLPVRKRGAPVSDAGNEDGRRGRARGAGANGTSLGRPGHPDRHGRGGRHGARLPRGAANRPGEARQRLHGPRARRRWPCAHRRRGPRRIGLDTLGRRRLSVRHGLHRRYSCRATSRTSRSSR